MSKKKKKNKSRAVRKYENIKVETAKINSPKQVVEDENLRAEEMKEKKESEEKIKEKHKKKHVKLIYLLNIIMIIIIAIGLFIINRNKFKDVTIELGTETVTIDEFLVSKKLYSKKAEFVTDISQIDFSRVGNNEIILSWNGKEESVNLEIIDTTPPKVVFKNIQKNQNYEINAEDFVETKEDLSEMTIAIIEKPEDISEYKDYNVKISVKDIYGNETIGEATLSITWLIQELHVELGESLEVSDLVLGAKENEDKIPKEELKKVDTKTIGEYEIKVEIDNKEYKSKIIVEDTTPPELALRDITIYDDESIKDYKKFIKKVSDASGTPETSLKTPIDYKNIGKQEITIEAVDTSGNKIEQTATLTIKKDNEGPVISGITDLTVAKHSTINYLTGVSANDAKDGSREVAVDSSSVNADVAGIYYATYTSSDIKGNTTTKKRKITVNHDQEDTNAKFNEFYNSYCAGKDPVGMASAIREQIKYNSNWGGDDPVWYGLTEGRGNCYVHANIMQKCLQKAGYSSQIIYLVDQSHYWNIVNVGGVWRHIDATPSANHTLGLLTDEEKWNDPGTHQKGWDREKWPAAE